MYKSGFEHGMMKMDGKIKYILAMHVIGSVKYFDLENEILVWWIEYVLKKMSMNVLFEVLTIKKKMINDISGTVYELVELQITVICVRMLVVDSHGFCLLIAEGEPIAFCYLDLG